MSTNPSAQQIDFGEYRQYIGHILGEKELAIAEAGLRIQQLTKRVEELESQITILTPPSTPEP